MCLVGGVHITVSVLPEEKEQLERLAAQLGKSMSEYARLAIIKLMARDWERLATTRRPQNQRED